MSVNVGYKPRPAGIMFKFWPVEALVAIILVHLNLYRVKNWLTTKLHKIIKNYDIFINFWDYLKKIYKNINDI